MEITHYGGGCILVATKQLSILVDPVAEYKLKLPKLTPDVTLYTALRNPQEAGTEFIVDSPGEYEVKNVLVKGVSTQLHVDDPKVPKRGVSYTVTAEDVRLLATGNITATLSDQQREAIGEVNILAVPVGGHGLTLDANAAAQLVSQFEPQYVVPVHYNDGKATYPSPQDKLETFLQEMGGESPQAVDKLKVTAKQLEDQSQLVILKPQAK